MATGDQAGERLGAQAYIVGPQRPGEINRVTCEVRQLHMRRLPVGIGSIDAREL